jgi:sugar-specific transcriptional regulator TrmB
MDIEYELSYIGFTKNEIKIYLTLLRLGKSKAGRLAREARLERTSAYNALNRLISLGLVSYVIESNEKVFCAADPDKIPDIFREKEERAKKIIPELKKIKQFEREKEDVIKFKGYSGIKTVMNDILNSCSKGDEYLVLGMEGQLSQKLPTFAEIFVARKDSKKIKSRAIIRKLDDGRKISQYTNVRYIPYNLPSKVNINIYGNKVAVLIWSDNPEAVILDSKEAAESFRSYFEFMWKHAQGRSER